MKKLVWWQTLCITREHNGVGGGVYKLNSVRLVLPVKAASWLKPEGWVPVRQVKAWGQGWWRQRKRGENLQGAPEKIQGPENASVARVPQTRSRVVDWGWRGMKEPDSSGPLRQHGGLWTWSKEHWSQGRFQAVEWHDEISFSFLPSFLLSFLFLSFFLFFTLFFKQKNHSEFLFNFQKVFFL